MAEIRIEAKPVGGGIAGSGHLYLVFVDPDHLPLPDEPSHHG
jgi:hypothetical protein